MSSVRIIGTVALVALAGCTLLTGASDLTTEPATGSGTKTGPEGGADGGSTADGGDRDDAGNPSGTDGSVDPPVTAGIRAITFEGGKLTGAMGADTTTGAATCSAAAPLRGKYSLLVSSGGGYVEAAFAPQNDLYMSLVFALDQLPSNIGRAVTLARISFDGTATTLDLTVDIGGALALVAGGASAGLGKIAPGVTYRVGLHARTNGATELIDGQLAVGATGVFDGNRATVGFGALGAASRVAFGNLGQDDFTGRFDHALLDATSMPGP